MGRVQTPTLAMLAERQDKIEHFQKEAFYKVALTDGRLTVVSENIANEEAADLLASLCMDSEAVITQVKREQKKAFPPKLYDLTSLQRKQTVTLAIRQRKHWICCRNYMKKSWSLIQERTASS